MRWYVHRLHPRLVCEETGQIICFCDTGLHAGQIVKDHNESSVEILTEDQKDAIRSERRKKSNDFGSSYRG